MNVTLPTISVLKEFFFAGMSAGWAGGMPPQKVTSETLGKHYDYVVGSLWLSDEFSGNRFGVGFEGSTRLLYYADNNEWQLLWVMHYVGFTDKDADDFLRQALMANYSNEIFCGGRGPAEFTNDDRRFLYHNKAYNGRIHDSTPRKERGKDLGEDFAAFNGFEEIVERNNTAIRRGWCEYHGHLLVPRSNIEP